MSKYIITSEPTKIWQKKRALFYATDIGRKRIYRQSQNSPSLGMKILEYRTIVYAQKICDEINSAHNDSFKVEEMKCEFKDFGTDERKCTVCGFIIPKTDNDQKAVELVFASKRESPACSK